MSLLPDTVDALGPSVEIDEVEGVTVLGVNPAVLSRTSRLIKRGFDLLVAGAMLLLGLPILLIAAVAIKLDSRGPVLFRQERVGKGGRPFRLLKLRTMVVDAERMRGELLDESRDDNWLHLENDPRITRVGRILRLASIDELPQLWNVIRGEMSMVGPRPLIEEEDRRIGGLMSGAARPDAGHHRPLAGAREDQYPVRRDGQARLPVRDELVSVVRRSSAPQDAASGRQAPRRKLVSAAPLGCTRGA